MDIGGWLQSLGLKQYEAVFRENAIDADVLHDLTEDHLREMGLPLGARLKLLKAISALAPSAEPIGLTPVVAPAGPPADTAERRQVTVMFADWSARRRFQPAWTRRTCARSFRPIRNAPLLTKRRAVFSGISLS